MAHGTQFPNNDGWLSWIGKRLVASAPTSFQRILTPSGELFSTAPENTHSTSWHNRSKGIVEIQTNGEEKPLEPISATSSYKQSGVRIAKLATGLFAIANIPGVSATGGMSYLSTIASGAIPKGIPWTLGPVMSGLSLSSFWEAFGALSPMAQGVIGTAVLGTALYGAYKAKKSAGTPASITMTSPESDTKTTLHTYERTITCSNGRRFKVFVNLAKGLENTPELSQIEEFWKTTVLEPLSNGSYDVQPKDELNITFTDDGWTAERMYKDEPTKLAAETAGRESKWKHEIKSEEEIEKIETLKEITNNFDYPTAKIVQILSETRNLQNQTSVYRTTQTEPYNRTTQIEPYLPRFKNRGADCWLNSAMQMYLSIPEFREAMEDKETARQRLRKVMRQCRQNEQIITLGGLIPKDDGTQKDIQEGFHALENLFQFPTPQYTDKLKGAGAEVIQDIDKDASAHHIIDFPVPNLGPDAAAQDFKKLTEDSLKKTLEGGISQSRIYQEVPKVLNFSGIRNGPGENGQFGVRSDTKIDVPMIYELNKKEHLDDNLQETPDKDLQYELMSFAVQLPSLPGTVNGGHWIAYRRVVCFDQNGKRKDRFYKANDDYIEEITENRFKRTAKTGSSWLYRQQKLNESARPLQPIQLPEPPNGNIVLPPPAQNPSSEGR